jgi:hypothetical protein
MWKFLIHWSSKGNWANRSSWSGDSWNEMCPPHYHPSKQQLIKQSMKDLHVNSEPSLQGQRMEIPQYHGKIVIPCFPTTNRTNSSQQIIPSDEPSINVGYPLQPRTGLLSCLASALPVIATVPKEDEHTREAEAGGQMQNGVLPLCP